MPKSFLVKKKTERYKRLPSAQIVSSPGNGFVREFNQISAIQSDLVDSVQESTARKPQLMEARFKIVCEPNKFQIQNQILNQPLVNNKTPTEPQSRGGDHCFVKQALVASTNANGLQSASGNLISDGKIKQLCNKNQCQHCKKSYTSVTNLLRHQQFHCSPHQKRPFHCKHCEKLYVSLGALKMHIRTHTLPCKCKICGKAFSRPWLLQGHIRTHTGEKPYRCPQCQRAFADRSNLRAHLQTHSDVKKYSCSRCSKSFSRMSLLTKHEDSCPVFLPNTTTL